MKGEMMEGKLKDRFLIGGIENVAGEIQYYPDAKDIDYLNKDTVFAVLDEAAKEFPMTAQQIRILSGGPVYESDLVGAGIADPVEVAKWFKKHFGDTAKTTP